MDRTRQPCGSTPHRANDLWRLKDFPDLGRESRRMAGRRELTFAPLPYIVVYQVKHGVVEISRVFHGAQDWP